MKHSFLLLIIGLLLTTGCSKENPVNTSGTENIAGTYYRTITTSDNQERSFIVYIPTSAEGQQKVPVLFMIHGTNQTGQVHYDKNLWNAKADQEGFIVIYPTALVYCHYDNGVERTTTKWAAGDLGETDTSMRALPLCPNEVLKDDLRFFDELTATIKADYIVDEKRFYLTGFSNGAQMTARLATERPEVYAAVTVHAGNLSKFIPTTLSSRPMSMIVSVGAKDGLFLEIIGEPDPIPVDTTVMNISGVVDVLQPFLDINGLDNLYSYSGTQNNGVAVADFTFETSNIGLNNSIRFVVIEGLGHNYTDLLINPFWTFLEGQSLP